ncbi:hypothetical protein HJC23_007422 [Cyclotella cryptica]|uniref:BTB domain-containing protein n=1 Tax=Cyclotella cryptica TaxID=29204 RepID=A0ABD3QJ95_9STRA|eukprot:CCRYP_005160-RB/>CCRYP_005160-RB protein AED:0.07 eAED:0.07 QI:409/1/1/1/0.5/0.33/3/1203/693
MERNNPPDLNADEAAAQAIQAAIWLADEQELGEDEMARQLLQPNPNAGGGGGVGGVVPELVRQLLRERRRGMHNHAHHAEERHQAPAAPAVEENEEVDGEAMDAGVAGEVFDESGGKVTSPAKCPLMLYLEIDDDLEDLAPKNKYLKRGSTVYIGLDKTTKLSRVFQQFCTFINKESTRIKGKLHSDETLSPKEFEFVHCTLLDAMHTVEASAMMKNDRIMVRRDRSKERAMKAEIVRLQRESDRKYFNDLRQLLHNSSPDFLRGCDVILDCRGKVVDERGFSQNVLATMVRANSAVLSKRCKWLAQKIMDAKEEIRRRAEMTVPSDGNDKNDEGKVDDSFEGGQKSDDEDDIVPSFPERDGPRGGGDAMEGNSFVAAKVEDDEEDDVAFPPAKKAKLGKSAVSPNTVIIPLDHSPEAVKLLLEYSYTNRVHSLGFNAFVKASRYVGPGSTKELGPVPPFRKHEWPKNGMPTVSLHLALAGIALAEEAQMPRLSLMCEVAASQLVNQNNVIDVLSTCQSQLLKTGNRLPILKKAAMLDCIFPNGSTGIDRLMEKPNFKTNLEEKRNLVIPSLLEGTVELLPSGMLATKDWQKKKEKMETDTNLTYLQEDKVDKNNREMQRKKYRSMETINRRVETAFGSEDLSVSSPLVHLSFRQEPPPIKLHRVNKRKSRSDVVKTSTVTSARRGKRDRTEP